MKRMLPRWSQLSKCMAAVSLLLGGTFWLPTPAQAATRQEAGITTSATLLHMSSSDLHSRLSDIKRLGATWIRIDVSWPAIQPDGPGSYSWDAYDHVVHEATAQHLKILAVLAYTPAWAQTPQCAAQAGSASSAQKCAPRSAQEFGHFAAMVSARYRHQAVRGWEIWNEPNLTAYWKSVQRNSQIAVDPQAYAQIANAAAQQIRQHDPDSVIVTGGLAPLFEPHHATGLRQSDYLAQLLPHLNRDLFDGVSIHPYSWPVLPSRAAVYNAFYTVDHGRPRYNLRTIMQRAGWGSKQIWGTEFGASTKGVRAMARPTRFVRPDHVTESTQAQIVQQGVDDWYKKSNVGPLFVYSDSDKWLSSRKPNEDGFGLKRSNGTNKPAYDAYQMAVKQLKQSAYQ
ncbi:MAG TPA: family 1 glycosylhydrolase [Candidatus Saccharimonadia bacterium]|nr:family 1 glycosylhydrolase [Candidatus Saccharimonadia bacterium]